MEHFLSWREAWSTRIDWVDRDHQEMLKRLNALVDACRCHHETGDRVPCKERVLACLNALIEHNRQHFQAEENFLRQIEYPGYEEHRREHVMQMAEFVLLRQDLERDLAENMGAETIEGFKCWFLDHVVAEDHVYAEYFHDRFGDRSGSLSGDDD